MNGVQIEIPRVVIEQIAREVFEQSYEAITARAPSAEAEEIATKLAKINAKQFITISEFAFLFNCSPGHVSKLLQLAQDPKTEFPVPHVNLDGLVQFDRLEVLQWARIPKALKKGQRKTGGKRKRALAAIAGQQS